MTPDERPDENTEELSDFELTQRLRAARGQAPLPDPNSIEVKLREAADRVLRGVSYDHITIDDPIRFDLDFKIDTDPSIAPGRFEWKVPVDYVHTVKPISYGVDYVRDDTAWANALALAGGDKPISYTTTGTDFRGIDPTYAPPVLKPWTPEK
jgi:hypothetical protein